MKNERKFENCHQLFHPQLNSFESFIYVAKKHPKNPFFFSYSHIERDILKDSSLVFCLFFVHFVSCRRKHYFVVEKEKMKIDEKRQDRIDSE